MTDQVGELIECEAGVATVNYLSIYELRLVGWLSPSAELTRHECFSYPPKLLLLSRVLTDALHRQIGIVHVKRLLSRKSEQTRVEGSRRASASHATRPASSTGTVPSDATVPVEGPT